ALPAEEDALGMRTLRSSKSTIAWPAESTVTDRSASLVAGENQVGWPGARSFAPPTSSRSADSSSTAGSAGSPAGYDIPHPPAASMQKRRDTRNPDTMWPSMAPGEIGVIRITPWLFEPVRLVEVP